jgi:hypothetical protein
MESHLQFNGKNASAVLPSTFFAVRKGLRRGMPGHSSQWSMREDLHASHQYFNPHSNLRSQSPPPEREVSMSIEQMMKDGKTDSFLHYQDGERWYRTAAGFDFPEPINTQGAAAFLVQDKAMQFVR